MMITKLASVCALGLLAITGCAATGSAGAALPAAPHTMPRLDLTVDDTGATPSFPAHLAAPIAPAVTRSLATRVRTELAGRARADVRLCVGGDGAVTDVALIRGSGLGALDATLLDLARGWRYQPLTIPSATVCQRVAIGYTVR